MLKTDTRFTVEVRHHNTHDICAIHVALVTVDSDGTVRPAEVRIAVTGQRNGDGPWYAVKYGWAVYGVATPYDVHQAHRKLATVERRLAKLDDVAGPLDRSDVRGLVFRVASALGVTLYASADDLATWYHVTEVRELDLLFP